MVLRVREASSGRYGFPARVARVYSARAFDSHVCERELGGGMGSARSARAGCAVRNVVLGTVAIAYGVAIVVSLVLETRRAHGIANRLRRA